MDSKQRFVIGVVGMSCVVLPGSVIAGGDDRQETGDFRDVNVAMGVGYASTGSCVSEPQEGAMGIHFANGDLIEDGVLDAQHPELLIYEQRNGRLRLEGV